ncbi:MAG: glucose-1-phosphate adenylyltransferase, partial [Saprospiraceae bacterium]|nr:glucose-1-phosphate adenylyltransferase [Saprospiraceae bacterium]
MIKMICLILGGGVGSRLYPLTDQRSKPAVPIGGKYRLIDIPISNCINSGVKRMFVLTQFNSASLNTHIKNTYHFDVFNPGFVDILAAEQTRSSDQWYQGTADAVRQSMHHLVNHDHDYVLILSGDHLYQMDFEAFAENHIKQNAAISIATIPCTAKDATGFGIMKVNGDGVIESFIEKPKPDVLENWKSEMPEEDHAAGRDYLASMGIYIFNKQALQQLFDENPDATDFGKELIPKAIEAGMKVSSFQFNGYWTDIGTISSFFESNIALTSDIPQFNLFDNNNPVYTRARMLPPSKIFGTRMDKAVVSEGCIIHGESISQSVIGIRSRIGKGTSISNTIMMGSDFYQTIDEMIKAQETPMGIGDHCVIDHAIIDKNVKIGDNVTIKGGTHLEDR